MPLTHSTDQVARAKARLLQQYKDTSAPGVGDVVAALGSEVQALEDALFTVVDDTTADAAVGVNLDRIGALVGQDRLGMDDATYLLWVKARIRANRSSGSIDQILAVFMLLNPGATFEVVEQFPAAFELRIENVAIPQPSQQAAILRTARKAGVRSFLIATGVPSVNGFCFLGGIGKGFPDAALTPGSGGQLAAILF